MPSVAVVYWRDIPAQVIVGKGRRAAKIQLSERFEQAIDRCAMRSNAKDTDSYLSEWNRRITGEIEGDPFDIAANEAKRLEEAYAARRLKKLVDRGGWARPGNQETL